MFLISNTHDVKNSSIYLIRFKFQITFSQNYKIFEWWQSCSNGSGIFSILFSVLRLAQIFILQHNSWKSLKPLGFIKRITKELLS